MEACTRLAWWGLKKPDLVKIAGALDLAVPAGSTATQVQVIITMHVLGCTEQEALEIVKFKLKYLSQKARDSKGELNSLEEGMEFVDRDEREAIQREKKKLSEQEDVVTDFTLEYASEAKRLNPQLGTGRVRKIDIAAGEITTAQANKYKPPNSFIWRDNVVAGGGWKGHYPPYKRVGASAKLAGSKRDACIKVLRHLWKTHLTLTSQSLSRCPIKNLFLEAEARAGEFVHDIDNLVDTSPDG